MIALAAAHSREPVPLIFDTDMGNDIDDALALAMIHSLEARGECKLLAVTLTKDQELAAPFVDLVNTFYGRPDIPIGVVRNGATPEEGNYLRPVVEARIGDAIAFPRRLASGADAPEATGLLRQALADQKDGSVVIVMVGFSTNLARLLESPADSISPLAGPELVAKKCKLLSAMAGNFAAADHVPEYNIHIDIPSARTVFERWPTPIVASGFEIGRVILFPARSIEEDFAWTPIHPVAEAYKRYMKFPYDRETWDLTAVLYAVRPDAGYFGLSDPGQIHIDDDGNTQFQFSKKGKDRYLTVTPEQIVRTREALIQLSTQPIVGKVPATK